MTGHMLHGPKVVRVEWLPGSDTLVGTCHCSARYEAQDPITMWTWLLAHPEGHEPGGRREAPAPSGTRQAVPA